MEDIAIIPPTGPGIKCLTCALRESLGFAPRHGEHALLETNALLLCPCVGIGDTKDPSCRRCNEDGVRLCLRFACGKTADVIDPDWDEALCAWDAEHCWTCDSLMSKNEEEVWCDTCQPHLILPATSPDTRRKAEAPTAIAGLPKAVPAPAVREEKWA